MEFNRENLKKELEKLLPQKRGKKFYSLKLGISVEEVESILMDLYPDKKLYSSRNREIDCETINTTGYYDHAPEPEEIMAKHNIDPTKWKLSNYWSIQKKDEYKVSALFTQIKPESKDIKEEFLKFIKGYTPKATPTKKPRHTLKSESCLVFNMQDAHWDKLDISGENNVYERFIKVEEKIEKVLKKATIQSSLQNVLYIIGSDMFNSEFTSMTTKGTPQTNILDYNESFELICSHQIQAINKILEYAANVDVVLVSGNHDEHASWYLTTWLQAYYRSEKRVRVDNSTPYTKYRKWNNTAMMFNHGDAIKPEKLAQMFPIEFKEQWSGCDNFYIFSGDKHHELAKDIGGIKFYQIPALSTAKSKWDAKNGHTITKAALTAFLLEDESGVTEVYQETIK